jgi:hypothetical protein
MTDTTWLIPLAFGFAAGMLAGAAVAGAILLETPWYWSVFIRLPGSLYDELAQAALNHRCSVKTEILDRLMDSVEGGRS